MRALYTIYLYDVTTNENLGAFTDFAELQITTQRNAVTISNLTFPWNSEIVNTIQDNDRVVVVRNCYRPFFLPGTDTAEVLEGIYKGSEAVVAQDGSRRVNLLIASANIVLDEAVVAYRAGTAGRSQFTAEKTSQIAKDIAENNIVETGDDTGREASIPNTDVVASTGYDTAGDVAIDADLEWRSLMSAANQLSERSGLTINALINNATGKVSVSFFPVDFGVNDRREVFYSVGRGTMKNSSQVEKILGEKTIAIVGGDGEGASRNVIVRQSNRYDVDRNYAEMFVDGRGLSSDAALQDLGDTAMEASRNLNLADVDAIQIQAANLFTWVTINALVTVETETPSGFIQEVHQVTEITINVDGRGNESIMMRTEEYDYAIP